MFERLVYRSMLGTCDQTKVSVTYIAREISSVLHPSTLGCSRRKALLQQKFEPISPFNCKLIEVFAYFAAYTAAGRAASITVSHFKILRTIPA